MYVHVIHFICHYIFSSLLAERKEYARQSRASEEVMRDRVMEIKEVVEEEKVSKREITNGECGSPSLKIRPAQLSCLSGSVGRASA